jgi:hypothetical protein
MISLSKLFLELDNSILWSSQAGSTLARAAIVKKTIKALDAEPIKVQFYDEKDEKLGGPVYLRD